MPALQAHRLRLGSFPGRQASWSPEVLPLLGWWSIDAGGELYGDPSTTTEAGADLQAAHATLSAAQPGDLIRVNSMTDRSGNGHHLVQAGVATNKPLFGEGETIAGLHAVNHLANGGTLQASWTEEAQPYTVAMVLASFEQGVTFMWDGIDTNRRHTLQVSSGGTLWSLYAGTVFDTAQAFDEDGTPRTYACQYNGAGSQFWRAGALAGTGDAGAQASAGITIGARFNGASNGQFTWCEALAIAGELDAGEMASLLGYLANKWGV